MTEKPAFQLNDRVLKVGEDSTFEGNIVSVFTKRSGKIRYVVENDDGVLHIASLKQLKFISPQAG
jgi:hypothetical protein